MVKKQPQRHEVTIEFEGKTYSASYSFSSGIVTVESFQYGSASTHPIGGISELTAKILFREILEGAKQRGEIKED